MGNESIDKILGELKRVGQMLETFQKTGTIPDIERDLVLSKLRNMYEFFQFIQLEKVNMVPSAPPPQKEFTEEIQAILKEEADIQPHAVREIEFEIENVIPPAPPVIPEKETAPVKEDSTPVEPIPMAEKKKPAANTTILAEKFQQNSRFLNEALSKFSNFQDIARKYQTKPIQDISSAISLNEKFLYIKELFNNDGELYKQTITTLNTSGDFNKAVQYLDEHFTWDFDDFQVQKIVELIHRRYMQPDE